MAHDKIAVVDFDGQYAHLIATKVRRLEVLAEIRQPEDPIEAFDGYNGILLSGSPSLSSFGEDSDYTRGIYDLQVPILGFCFGHHVPRACACPEPIDAGGRFPARFRRLRRPPDADVPFVGPPLGWGVHADRRREQPAR